MAGEVQYRASDLIAGLLFGCNGPVREWVSPRSCSQAQKLNLHSKKIVIFSRRCFPGFGVCFENEVEISEDFKGFLLHARNPRRFPGFAVVVVTFSCEILHDFHVFVRNVSLTRGKSTTRFGCHRFFRRKVTIFIGREIKTHILPTKINEKNR